MFFNTLLLFTLLLFVSELGLSQPEYDQDYQQPLENLETLFKNDQPTPPPRRCYEGWQFNDRDTTSFRVSSIQDCISCLTVTKIDRSDFVFKMCGNKHNYACDGTKTAIPKAGETLEFIPDLARAKLAIDCCIGDLCNY